MRKKAIVVAGWVYSRTDGDRHFISGPVLCRLYGLPVEECIVVDSTHPETLLGLPDLPRYYPRYDEKYPG